MRRKELTAGIRSSLENFGLLEISETTEAGQQVSRAIGILPLYAVWRLPDLPLPC